MQKLRYKKAITKEDLRIIENSYDIHIDTIMQLFKGADKDTFIYRISARRGKTFFLKIRTGNFAESSVQAPQFLSRNHVKHIIAPVETASGGLFLKTKNYTIMLYPFINGKSAMERPLTKSQWAEFGKALKTMHTAGFPESVKIPVEKFTTPWRAIVKKYLDEISGKKIKNKYDEQFLKIYIENSGLINKMITRSDKLLAEMGNAPREYCLCHGDIHAGNILITDENELYIVDWDTLIMAPKERDLMFIGGGVADKWNTEKEEDYFYSGYGEKESVNLKLVSYYRYDRIIEDLVVYYDQFFAENVQAANQKVIMERVAGFFGPGSVTDMAFRGDV
jgi:spectinomycin phosphotransferase